MQTLRNKSVELKLQNGQKVKTDYKKLIGDVCRDVPGKGMGQGLDLEQLRKRMKITDIIEASNGTFKFENQQADDLKELVKAMQWGVVCKAIITFGDDIEAMEEIKK